MSLAWGICGGSPIYVSMTHYSMNVRNLQILLPCVGYKSGGGAFLIPYFIMLVRWIPLFTFKCSIRVFKYFPCQISLYVAFPCSIWSWLLVSTQGKDQ